jgi:hypothetical protein
MLYRTWSPDLFGQLPLCDQLPGMARHEREQVELGHCRLNRLTIAVDRAIHKVNR